MRVLSNRLLAVLDPEAAKPRRQGQGLAPTSARSAGSGRSGAQAPQPGAGESASFSAQRNPPSSARWTESARSKEGQVQEGEECSAFELLHTEKGFGAFSQWYKRLLESNTGSVPQVPRSDLGLWWPQAHCPPTALHEHAFAELLRAFAECTDGEAMDFFDLLDHDFLGALSTQQVYIAICLVAAIGSRQLTKFFYFHSTRIFGMLAKGCRFSAEEGCVAWPKLLMLLRLLGAPGHLISRVSTEHGVTPLSRLKYESFLEIVFPIVVQLDQGADVGEITVINEVDRHGHVRSKMCTIL